MTDGQPHSGAWYPDPSGVHQLRYYDTTWTDQVSDAGVVTTSPLTAPAIGVGPVRQLPPHPAPQIYPPVQGPTAPAPYPQPYGNIAPPRFGRKVGWIIGAGVAAAVVGVIAVAVAASGSKSSGGGGAASVSQFCADLNSEFDKADGHDSMFYVVLNASTWGPGTDVPDVPVPEIQATIGHATNLAAEAPTSVLKTDLTTIAADLRTDLATSGGGGPDASEQVDDVMGWETGNCS